MSAFEDALRRLSDVEESRSEHAREIALAGREFAALMKKHHVSTNFRHAHAGRTEQYWFWKTGLGHSARGITSGGEVAEFWLHEYGESGRQWLLKTEPPSWWDFDEMARVAQLFLDGGDPSRP
ncbi:hypothetical protein [Nocardia amamiensis]|uniref:hypothetical protein n=1 Tax=Nocardia amamiensis TaxID=404578 RepID=UPI000832B814|nr:hypothetical protein [Nocardia amamiensis]